MSQEAKVDILTKEAFNQFYKNELTPVIQELERDRKRIVGKLWLVIFSGIAVLVLSGMLNRLNFEYYIYVAFGGVFVVWKFFQIVLEEEDELKLKVKTTAINPLIKRVNESFKYIPNQTIHKKIVNEAGFFKPKLASVSGDDYVEGKVYTEGIHDTSTEMTFCEIEGKYSFSSHQRTVMPFFRGLFYVVDFNKHFDGHVYVFPKKKEIEYTLLENVVEPDKETFKKVELESVSFTKLFDVYGTDPILTRYILTPRLMERIEQFSAYAMTHEAYMTETFPNMSIAKRRSLRRKKKGYGVMPFFSFKNGMLYILIPTQTKHFEFKLMKRLDERVFENYYYDIILALRIVEELNLNLRIWTKQ